MQQAIVDGVKGWQLDVSDSDLATGKRSDLGLSRRRQSVDSGFGGFSLSFRLQWRGWCEQSTRNNCSSRRRRSRATASFIPVFPPRRCKAAVRLAAHYSPLRHEGGASRRLCYPRHLLPFKASEQRRSSLCFGKSKTCGKSVKLVVADHNT